MRRKKHNTVEEYISDFPQKQKTALKEFRNAVKKIVPAGEEVISYNIPAIKFHGLLVHFAAYNQHIGFYPGSGAINAFKDKLKTYETSKGTVRFPLDKALPLGLIKQIVRFRVLVNLEKESIKIKKKKN